MGNCSCGNSPQERQLLFEEESKVNKENFLNQKIIKDVNLEEILNNINSQIEDTFTNIEPISLEKYNQSLYSFPNVKELFEEYNSQISKQSQKDLPIVNQSTNLEPKEKDLLELPNPIKLIEEDGKIDLFKGSINENKNFTGVGCYITDNYLYNGYFKNNEFNGKGIMINKDGSSLFGDWINGVCTGKGILKINNQYEYEGDFVENKKHGYGIEKYPDGSKYEGEFKNNKKNGKGKYMISKGESYEGEFKDDLFDGEGIYKWPSESREYKGQFKNGNMNGKGINKFKDGSIYEGYYKNGLKHGSGKYTWPNGKVFYGNWLNNKLHGNGYYLLDNEKYNITFRFGKIISTRKTEDFDENKRIKFTYEDIIDKEKLEDANKYICPICNTILNNPQNCCSCFKNYCNDCIKNGNENKKCLRCGGNAYESNLDLLHELMSKININCNICHTPLDYKTSLTHSHT